MGAGGLRASPPLHPRSRPVTCPSSPEWAAGVPLPPPATAPPRSARARSLHQHQKTHRVFNARKKNASCFPIVPPCTRLTKTSLPSLLEAEATRGASRRSEHNGRGASRWPLGRAGSGALALGGRRGEATPRDPALRIPQQLGRACAGHGPGGQGTKLQEAGPRRGPSSRHTKRGLRPGRPGPAHKGSEARAASGPRRGPRAPRLPSFLLAGGGGCRRGRRG